MTLPGTYAAALALAILTMICWGSWANTVKLAGRWRFELFYFDYSFGVFLAALIAGATFGSIDNAPPDAAGVTFSLWDNLTIAWNTSIAYGVGAGVLFNLANMLLVAAIAVAGMSVAFPIGIGLALIIGVVLNQFIRPAGNGLLLFGGSFLVLLAIVASALAHAAHAKTKAAASVESEPPLPSPAARTARPLARARKSSGPSPALGIIISLVSGILMGLFYPLLELSRKTEMGLGPYAAAFCFAAGVLVSTPVFNLFFMNVPVQGEPVSFRDYFTGTFRQHALGILGGVIWCVGLVSNLAAASAPARVNLGPAISYALGQGATLISALWGLLVWKEFAGATTGVKVRLAVMLLLFVGGLAMVSVAPLYK
jgi:glucose uptake protein